ncbi:hypothetical protein [Terrabacter sp. MAHUQ-38]|uniref:hypothetical protein n=1 Tax=unclassified Terrabacter TaxID=2630222 RepID=UPI00165E0F60|nr:hypothetical protein [Terrabacter sp. MAHUQ-38]MBC9820850.1 hypothetical protein [Terrabacter sp. MAHUQ-38]
MSTGTLSFTPQEALARELILERSAARHHAPRQAPRTRRHVRAALLLRSLAERLDPSAGTAGRPSRRAPVPHARSPRPWSAAPRRTPHRHT